MAAEPTAFISNETSMLKATTLPSTGMWLRSGPVTEPPLPDMSLVAVTVWSAVHVVGMDVLMSGIANEVVDYMLFVEEPLLPRPVASRSGFAGRMAATGPRDRKGRTLYELDLSRRLLKYPCSYLIYSPAFDALPPLASAPIYRRLWEVLSGQAPEPRYRALSLADRQAIAEILIDTKPGLPAYFSAVTR